MRRKLLNFKRSSTTDGTPVTEYGAPIDVTDDGSPASAQRPAAPSEQVVETGSVFDSVLSQELLAPTVATAEPPPAPGAPMPASPPAAAAPLPSTLRVGGQTEHVIVESSIERDLLRAEMSDVELPGQVDNQPSAAAPGALSVDQLFDATHAPEPAPLDHPPLEPPLLDPPLPASSEAWMAAPSAMPSTTSVFPELSFWDRYDEATASAELFAVPPAAITAIVGALHVAAPVAERCRASHWVTECDVYVLTSRPELIEDPTWKVLKRPSDVVALLDDGLSDFPLLVVDIPRELPTWIRPLTSRLRAGGVGLVRYVLDDDPSDEDLATWHGELGRPSVLDLVAAVPPARVLDLLDRGEPVASVGGMPITADLLMALRLSV